MIKAKIRILSGEIKELERSINAALASGWLLMGPATFAGNRKDPRNYPPSEETRPFLTVTLWKQSDAQEEAGE